MLFIFAMIGTLVLIGLVGFMLFAMQRLARQEPIMPDQDFYWRGDDLITPNATFTDQQIHFRHEPRVIGFDEVRGVFVRGMRSRRIAVGVVLHGEELITISHISNNEMNRALRNAEMIADTLANQGAQLREAWAQHPDQRQVLMGAPFVFIVWQE